MPLSNKKTSRTVKSKNKRTSTKTRKLFTKNNYNSDNGMMASTWGPAFWHVLHTISFNYSTNPTQKQKKHYQKFILSLRSILPCKYCRTNLTKNLKELPLTMKHMENRHTFSKYIYSLHELVNKMLKKKSNLTYTDVKNRYENFRAKCASETTSPRTLKNKSGSSRGSRVRTLKVSVKSELGCVTPLNGKKSKCILNIVPQTEHVASFQVDKRCNFTK